MAYDPLHPYGKDRRFDRRAYHWESRKSGSNLKYRLSGTPGEELAEVSQQWAEFVEGRYAERTQRLAADEVRFRAREAIREKARRLKRLERREARLARDARARALRSAERREAREARDARNRTIREAKRLAAARARKAAKAQKALKAR
jgi:hypothetical protein